MTATPPPHRANDDPAAGPQGPPGPQLPPSPRWLKYCWAATLTAAVLGSAVVETVDPGNPSGPPLRALVQILACPRMAEDQAPAPSIGSPVTSWPGPAPSN